MFENIRPQQHPHTKLWGVVHDHDYGDRSPATVWLIEPYYKEEEFIMLLAKIKEAEFNMPETYDGSNE